MVDRFLEIGLYVLGVVAASAVGVALIWWGQWGDRSKGRPRCPKCWYDMRGTLPCLECPECGYKAKHERRLHQDHQRRGVVVLGVVLVTLSVVLGAVLALRPILADVIDFWHYFRRRC